MKFLFYFVFFGGGGVGGVGFGLVFFVFKKEWQKEWEILRRWFIPKWHCGRLNTYRSSCGSGLRQIPEAKPVVRINVRALWRSVKLLLLMSRGDLTLKDTEVMLCYPPVRCVSHSVKGVQLLLTLDEMRWAQTTVVWLRHRSTREQHRAGPLRRGEGRGQIYLLPQ